MPHNSWLIWKALTACFIGGPIALIGLFYLYQAYLGKRR